MGLVQVKCNPETKTTVVELMQVRCNPETKTTVMV
jgi:hypothetical protein